MAVDNLQVKDVGISQQNVFVGSGVSEPVDLRYKPRIHEQLIRGFLLLCGILSIFTTIGIIIVLGNESISLFTRTAWIDTNKHIAQRISETMTDIRVGEEGAALNVGDHIRIHDEEMTITAINGTTLTVERGINNTIVDVHASGAEIRTGADVTLIEYFTGTEWLPQLSKFGVIPLINSTLIVSTIAMLVALPLGIGAAIYLSEYAKPRVRATLKPILEVLAGIPTVVYGYFALTFMTPLLQGIFGVRVEQFNMLSGGIVVGILIIPLVSSLSEDALSSVPRALREASYGLGATKLETSLKVVLPAALSGIIAAFIIAISRAIGETMIVAIAVGAGPKFTFNVFEGAETMTGHIARISGGDISYDSIDYNSLFAIGLTLFVMTLALSFISRIVTNRFREVYQ